MTAPKFAVTEKIQMKDTVAVAIVDPRDGSPAGLHITVAGRYSPQGKAAQLALAESARAEKDAASAASWDARLLSLVTGCTVAWDALDVDGKAIPCTAENVRALYDGAPWIREQVQAHYLDTARFFESAKAS